MAAAVAEVVAESETAAELRGRAQWLIGETFYMQRQYKPAIEAYRKVEAIDTSGTWVAASFLQAGKAFEHMGGIKEATLCYVTLLQGLADLAAWVAQGRNVLHAPRLAPPLKHPLPKLHSC